MTAAQQWTIKFPHKETSAFSRLWEWRGTILLRAAAELVGNEGGENSGVISLKLPGDGAPHWGIA